MSDSDFSGDEQMGGEEGGPMIEVIYPLNEETEVPRTSGQLFKTVLQEGTGSKPPRGAKVSVHYVGTLATDGTKFDSSRDRGDLFEFTIGQGQVIKGWDTGVATMAKGEKAMLRCLPEYAYGANGSPPTIPPNSTLNFEVELFDWSKSEDISENKDKSITKDIQVEGAGYDTPDYEAVCVANVTGFVHSGDDENPTKGSEQLFEKKEWSVVIGDAENLPPGLELALMSMKVNESCVIHVSESANNSSSSCVVPVKSGVRLVYVVELTSMEKVKSWDFKGADKITEGLKRKDQGNAYFKTQQWDRASKKYKRALEFVEHEYGFDTDDLMDEAKKVKISVLNNLAQVLINTKQYSDAITYSNKCLEADGGHNAKALFRRAKAKNMLDEWADAKADLKLILDMDAANADAANELQAVIDKEKAYDKKMKSRFGKMFA